MTVPAPSPLSTRGWRRVKVGVTAALFAVATTGGVALAAQAPAVSPVAPAAAAALAAPAPAPVSVGGHGHGHGHPDGPV